MAARIFCHVIHLTHVEYESGCGIRSLFHSKIDREISYFGTYLDVLTLICMIVAAVELQTVFDLSVDIGIDIEAVCVLAPLSELESVPVCLVRIILLAAARNRADEHSVLGIKCQITAVSKYRKSVDIVIIEIDINDSLVFSKTCVLSAGYLRSIVFKRCSRFLGLLAYHRTSESLRLHQSTTAHDKRSRKDQRDRCNRICLLHINTPKV